MKIYCSTKKGSASISSEYFPTQTEKTARINVDRGKREPSRQDSTSLQLENWDHFHTNSRHNITD